MSTVWTAGVHQKGQFAAGNSLPQFSVSWSFEPKKKSFANLGFLNRRRTQKSYMIPLPSSSLPFPSFQHLTAERKKAFLIVWLWERRQLSLLHLCIHQPMQNLLCQWGSMSIARILGRCATPSALLATRLQKTDANGTIDITSKGSYKICVAQISTLSTMYSGIMNKAFTSHVFLLFVSTIFDFSLITHFPGEFQIGAILLWANIR